MREPDDSSNFFKLTLLQCVYAAPIQPLPLQDSALSIRDNERFIYTVRHGERIDNIDKNWKESRKAKGEIWDDPPLSERGMQQALETGQYLSNLSIAAVFVSPFTRTIQTANQVNFLPFSSGFSYSLCNH